jgi:DNA-binding CsgD family transcriptional regulator
MITLDNKTILKLSERNLAVLVFSLFFSWLLAIPFEGQTLYLLLAHYNIDFTDYIFKSIAAHLAGLISCSFYVKNMKSARRLVIVSIAVCVAGASSFFFKPSLIWDISLIISSFAAGASVSAWAFYFKELTKTNERIKMAADGLIFSNILMICINVVSANVSVYGGLIIAMAMLSVGLIFAFKLPSMCIKEEDCVSSSINIAKPMILLCIFIIIITINSGLMYQVINPNFAHLEELVSWYWALPYIAAIVIMRNLSGSKRTYMLYVAIAMMGLGFVSFLVLKSSSISYILIDTLMLSSFGIFDLFWWSIIGEMLDYTSNPSRLLGIVLSSNVLGVLAGGMTGSVIYNSVDSKLNASLLALVVVFIILIILPVLHNQLSILLRNHAYIESVREKKKEKEKVELIFLKLTDRERQVAELLLQGRTYKMIAEELYLSENTVKTHIKNIYSKFNIQSKTELIKMLNK